ncbi:ATP-binding cassette, sub-B (MDR TAP), member 4 [Geranomyces michiganensis]|nr:ATP-binding cassette, sub-B (MDR TAP), member 4 [Geranomyces michiganensis]
MISWLKGLFGRPSAVTKKSEDGDDGDDEDEPKVSLPALFRFASTGDLIALGLAVLCSALNSSSSFAWVYILVGVSDVMADLVASPVGSATRAAAEADFQRNILIYVGLFLGLALFYAATAWGRVYLWTKVSEKQGLLIRRAAYGAILKQDIAWHDKNPAGETIAILTSHIDSVQDGIGDNLGKLVEGISGFAIGIVFALVVAWRLSLPLIACMTVLMLSSGKFYDLVASRIRTVQDATSGASGIANEVIGAIRTVKAFGAEKFETARYAEKLVIVRQAAIDGFKLSGLEIGFTSFYFNACYALGIWYAYRLHVDPSLNLSGTSALNALLLLLLGAETLSDDLEFLEDVQGACIAGATIFQMIDTATIHDQSTINVPVPGVANVAQESVSKNSELLSKGIVGNITFRNISFRYPARPDVPVLQNFSLDIPCGQVVAVVGPSGSGKSTLVALLSRLYQPESGQLLIDGAPIEHYNVGYLRDSISVVTQEPVLFGTTLFQNIAWGARASGEQPPPTLEAVQAACKLANIHEFIMTLPEQYETHVGERGASLSGGQKQRIAIARALLRDPPILLLDEATSALDTKSERQVQVALENSTAGRTTLVIAHRLSTIRNADLIVVMDKGVIVETGRHAELIARPDGAYARLAEAQQIAISSKTEVSSTPVPDNVDTQEDLNADLAIEEPTDEPQASPAASTDANMSHVVVEEPIKPSNWPFLRVFTFTRPNPFFMSIALFLSVVNGAFMPIFAAASATFLGLFTRDKATLTDDDQQTINKWALIYFGMAFADFFIPIARRILYGVVGEHVAERLRLASFSALLNQDVSYFDDHKNGTGVLAARLVSEADAVKRIVGGPSMGLIVQAFGGLGIGIVVAFMSVWQLTLVALIFTPFLGAGVYLELDSLDKLADATKDAHEQSCQLASETIQNIRTVATLGREDTFIELFHTESLKPYVQSSRIAALAALGVGAKEAINFVAYAGTFYYGSRFVLNGSHTPTEVIRALFVVLYSSTAIGWMYYAGPAYQKGKVSARSIFKLLDRKPRMSAGPTTGFTGASGQAGRHLYGVKAEDVHFRYANRPTVPVLQGLNVDVRPGQVVALCGSSGCGKSTLLSLLLRFYDALDGEVLVDGTNVRDWNTSALRASMSLVGQEPVIMSGTVAENIAYGVTEDDSRVLQERIEAAARQANIHATIVALPLGYLTPCGDHGIQFSGGQKQRIAIARALIRDPALLLLDEATSALDSQSERSVQKALDGVMTNGEKRTVITIAHKLSTIQHADLIIVVDQGRVVQQGTHQDLMAQTGGRYALMVTEQSLSASVESQEEDDIVSAPQTVM